MNGMNLSLCLYENFHPGIQASPLVSVYMEKFSSQNQTEILPCRILPGIKEILKEFLKEIKRFPSRILPGFSENPQGFSQGSFKGKSFKDPSQDLKDP